MICRAVSELKEKSGSSKAAILMFTLSHYKLSDNETKAALKGELEQVKESGASGSFSVGEKKSVRAAEKRIGQKSAARKHAKKPVSKTTKLNSKEPKVSGIKRKKLNT
uniref:H15 domain-containing protein n=1 Tax=Angiostrongylus cantonensis TaxID=6313 RepID=A0A0K0D8Y4_ANGCA